MSVLKLSSLVDLRVKVRDLVLFITSCTSIIILENTLTYCIEKNVVMVTLITSMFFSYSLACTFGCGYF
jgi:hypothetical protein